MIVFVFDVMMLNSMLLLVIVFEKLEWDMFVVMIVEVFGKYLGESLMDDKSMVGFEDLKVNVEVKNEE